MSLLKLYHPVIFLVAISPLLPRASVSSLLNSLALTDSEMQGTVGDNLGPASLISTENISDESEITKQESQDSRTHDKTDSSDTSYEMSGAKKMQRQDTTGLKVDGRKSENIRDDTIGTNQSGTCSTCGKKDTTDNEIKKLRIEMFQQTLLRELRLDPGEMLVSASAGQHSRFNVPKLPPSLIKQMQQDAPVEDKFYAEDLEIAIPGEYMGYECKRRHATGCASFDLKNKIQGGISQAEVWLYKMEDRNDHTKQTFDVYELNKTSWGYLKPTRLVIRREVFVREGWIKMDVTRAVGKWLEEGRDRQGLAFSCTTCKTRSYKALYGIKKGYKPLLVVKFAEEHLRRDKRSQPECNPDQSCCKFSLNINFFEIGMPKIIAPTSVNIGYCRGSCTRNDQYANNHTSLIQHVRTYTRLYNSSISNLTPCCVPVGDLSDLTVLEMKNQDIVITLLHNIIVNQCGCA